MQNIIGIDVGGSHVTLAQVDSEKREIIRSTYIRERVDSFAEAEVILKAWTDNIEKVSSNLKREDLLIGIAMPGPFDYEKGISMIQHGKFNSIYNFNVKDELAKRLNTKTSQIHFINDASAFLEGEIFSGLAEDGKRTFGVTLGTGLGTTFYNGNIVTDEDLWDSPLHDSICEDYLATRWFVNKYEELTGEKITGAKDLLNKDEAVRKKIFNEYSENFAIFTLKYIKYYDPEILIIGGNIAKSYPYFSEKLKEILKENNFKIEIKISEIFEDAAILGAVSNALKSNQSKNIK